MPAENLSDNLTNLSQSPGYKKFLGMPLIGSIVSKKKRDETTQKADKDNILVPRKILNRLLNLQPPEPEVQPMQAFDESSDILTNIYNVMRMDHDLYMKNMIADRVFDKKLEKIKESRTKELIELFAGKKAERERKEQVKKEIEELKKKLEEIEERSKKLEAEEPAKKGVVPVTPSIPTPAAPAAKPVVTPTPTVTPPSVPAAVTPKPVPKVTQPTAAPVKAPPSTPSVIKAPEAVGAGVTAARVAGIGVTAGAALMGKEALAKNIAKFESTASAGRSFGGDEYNAYNKGTKDNKIIPADVPIDFSKMTIAEYLRRGSLPKGDPQKLFAVGRYQIIPDTMKELVKQLKIDPNTTFLTPTTQDYLFSKGLIERKRKIVDDYITGKTSGERAKNEAIMALAKEFASVGVPYDTIRVDKIKQKDGSIKEVVVKLPKGSSYYAGIGGNKAHNPPELVGAALDEDRLKHMKTKQVLPEIKTGETVQNITNENEYLKKQSIQSSAPVVTILNTNNNVVKGSNVYEASNEDTQPPTIIVNQYK